MDGLFWPLMLVLLGVILLALEMFVPSGGSLGVMAGLIFLAAIVWAFTNNISAGTSTTVLVAIIVPVFLAVFAHWWPKTPIGKRMLLTRETDDLALDDEEQFLRTLIGKRGRTKTKMMPSGAVVIDSQTYDAATDGLPLDAGQPVEVIALRMKSLVVRPVMNDATPAPPLDAELARPAEDFGVSPFEDPLL